MNPIDEPIDWFRLAGHRSPGLAELPSGANSPRKWDVRKGYGVSGSGIVYTGDELAKFTIKLTLITAEEWAAWDGFKSLLFKAPAGAKPKALDIWHPILEEHGIKSVVVEDLAGPVQADHGVWVWDIKLLQYRAPKAAIAKPTGSTVTKPKPAVVKSDTDLLIERLTGQVQELSK